MNEHLTSEQIATWVLGEQPPACARHLAECGACSAQVTSLTQPLAQFRGAFRQWSALQALPAPKPIRVPWFKFRSVGMRVSVASAMVAVLVAIPIYQQQKMDRQRAEMARQDDLLLQQVNQDIARAVPATMEPLTELMSWSAASPAAGSSVESSQEKQ